MVARNNGHGAHEAPRNGRGRRIAIVVALVVVVAAAFAGGYMLATGDDPEPAASPSPSPSTTSSPEPSPSASTSPTITSQPSPDPVLEDGRHFVFARSARDDPATLRFDLAEFLTDQEAQDAAEDRGDEAANGYYIVNDNPRLRTLPVAETVRVRYISTSACCDLVEGTWDQFAEAVNGTAQTDLDASAPWWVTVRGGQIVRIEQQYLP